MSQDNKSCVHTGAALQPQGAQGHPGSEPRGHEQTDIRQWHGHQVQQYHP